jgi:hypothetical protein
MALSKSKGCVYPAVVYGGIAFPPEAGKRSLLSRLKSGGICDAAPPLKVRDLRLASNTLMVPRVTPKSITIADQMGI